MTDLTHLSALEIVKAITQKKYSALEITQAFLARVKKLNPNLNAFLKITEKEALTKAKQIDQKVKSGKKLGRLAAVPLAVKDIYLTEGIETTAGSKVLKGYLPQYSSTVYQRLMDEDAVLLGKTNTDCFAFGVSTENSGFGPTHNPWDQSRVPGGSSGGSAAAVAADLVPVALGTDTGGSIRQPASLCGISGLKPTYGRNSRYGITAMASSFDCPGPFARTVADLALLTSISAGQDPNDSTTSPVSVPDYFDLLQKTNLKGLKIGLPKEFFDSSADKKVLQSVQGAAHWFKSHGAILKEVSVPDPRLAIAIYYILVPCEISANMARYDGLRFGQTKKDHQDLLSYYLETRGAFMEPEMKRRIMIGTYALSAGYFDAYYIKASKARTLFKQDYQKLLKEFDVLLAPVSPITAWKIGEKVNDPLKMYLMDIYTNSVNITGLPSLALPCQFNDLPIGFQLIGNYFEEAKLFSLGHQYQQETDYHLKNAPL